MILSTTAVTVRLIFLAVWVCVVLITALVMLWRRKEHPDRSRLFFGIYSLVASSFTTIKIVQAIVSPEPPSMQQSLDASVSGVFYLVAVLMALYPIELMRPNWIRPKHIAAILAPWAVLIVIFIVVSKDNMTILYTHEEAWQHITEPNVWLRLLLTMTAVPFTLWVQTIQYNWHYSSVDKKHLYPITFGLVVISLLFIIHSVMKEHPVIPFLFYISATAFIMYVLYYELVIRIRVPQQEGSTSDTAISIQSDGCATDSETDTDRQHDIKPHDTKTDTAQTDTTQAAMGADASFREMVERLRNAVFHEGVWQNPDFMQEDLLRIVGTNRTYLLKAVKELGFGSFHEMLNRCRVEYVMEQLKKDPKQNLQTVFFHAGYRSRATASRNFLSIVGCSPSEYIEKMARENEPPAPAEPK